MHQRINIQQYQKTPEQIMELTAELRRGNKDTIIPLIEAHIELAYKISGKFIKRVMDRGSDKRDSIIAQAFYGLTRAVNDAANGALYDNNITPYIAKKVSGFIRDFLATDHLISIEKDAFKKMAEAGILFEFLPITLAYREDEDLPEIDENESFHPEVKESFKLPSIFFTEDASSELIDKLQNLEWDENDRTIMNKILEGMTYAEIGELLEKNERFVKYHIDLIQQRIQKIYESFGEVPNL